VEVYTWRTLLFSPEDTLEDACPGLDELERFFGRTPLVSDSEPAPLSRLSLSDMLVV
jgi:hypothetical protein